MNVGDVHDFGGFDGQRIRANKESDHASPASLDSAVRCLAPVDAGVPGGAVQEPRVKKYASMILCRARARCLLAVRR